MGGQVNVAVDASPSTDLNQVMSEIRDHYETVIGKNRKELEAWYQNKVRSQNLTLNYHHSISVTNGGPNDQCCFSDLARSQQWSRT